MKLAGNVPCWEITVRFKVFNKKSKDLLKKVDSNLESLKEYGCGYDYVSATRVDNSWYLLDIGERKVTVDEPIGTSIVLYGDSK